MYDPKRGRDLADMIQKDFRRQIGGRGGPFQQRCSRSSTTLAAVPPVDDIGKDYEYDYLFVVRVGAEGMHAHRRNPGLRRRAQANR